MTDEELREQMAAIPRPPFSTLLGESRRRNRRLLPLLEAEARRRGIDPRMRSKVVADCNRGNARPQASIVYDFDTDDEQAEDVARKYNKSSPIRPTNENYGPLGVNTRRSVKQTGRRAPIPPDSMYSSKSSSTTSYGNKQRVRAIDPEEHDNKKCLPSKNNYTSYCTKRRKTPHQYTSPLHFQEVHDVVLLDDEDVQPEEPVDCVVSDKWIEKKIYYPSSDDPEAVELSGSDIKCLSPGVYLSSPVINFYILYIKRERFQIEDGRGRFHMFNTYFYSKLQEALSGKGEFLKLRRWWKGVNIFQRGYIIIPIHGTSHWSLVIICIPAKESNSGPIILHLDSLGMHPSAEIFETVGRYLEAEWSHLRKNPPSDISISEAIWEDLPRNIHKEKVEVPGQNNAYDCGIFMLYYIKQFIRQAPERFTRDNLGMFSRSWFRPEDASDLRKRIRELLLEQFESEMVDDAISEAATSDGSDEEGIIKEGQSEVVTTCDSSEMLVGGGDASTSDEDIVEVGSLEEAPSIRECVLSEAAMFSDGTKDDVDTVNLGSVSPKAKPWNEIFPSGGSENNEVFVHRAPSPDIYSDSDIEITGVRNRRHDRPTYCIG